MVSQVHGKFLNRFICKSNSSDNHRIYSEVFPVFTMHVEWLGQLLLQVARYKDKISRYIDLCLFIVSFLLDHIHLPGAVCLGMQTVQLFYKRIGFLLSKG